MKNIHVLPTDKPSRLCKDELGTFYITESMISKVSFFKNQNIYITSDENIKEVDYVTNGKYVSQAINEWWTNFYIGNPELAADYWKIILTTDQDLIKDGVQSIPDEFLEWFVKNPSCEEVEWDKSYNRGNGKFYYKIIIPKEEPKCLYDIPKSCENSECRVLNKCNGDKVSIKQETLEEVSRKYLKNCKESIHDNIMFLQGSNFGAKWQQERMYSEEDMIEFSKFCQTDEFESRVVNKSLLELFKEFKKK
jgi:hypothetical protein